MKGRQSSERVMSRRNSTNHPKGEESLRTRFRWWKNVVTPFLGLAAFALLYDDFRPSLRWYLGLAIGAVLGAAYLTEEVFWIARNQGRPCANCGVVLRLKPFRVKATCPHCGEDL